MPRPEIPPIGPEEPRLPPVRSLSRAPFPNPTIPAGPSDLHRLGARQSLHYPDSYLPPTDELFITRHRNTSSASQGESKANLPVVVVSFYRG